MSRAWFLFFIFVFVLVLAPLAVMARPFSELSQRLDRLLALSAALEEIPRPNTLPMINRPPVWRSATLRTEKKKEKKEANLDIQRKKKNFEASVNFLVTCVLQ